MEILRKSSMEICENRRLLTLRHPGLPLRTGCAIAAVTLTYQAAARQV